MLFGRPTKLLTVFCRASGEVVPRVDNHLREAASCFCLLAGSCPLSTVIFLTQLSNETDFNHESVRQYTSSDAGGESMVPSRRESDDIATKRNGSKRGLPGKALIFTRLSWTMPVTAPQVASSVASILGCALRIKTTRLLQRASFGMSVMPTYFVRQVEGQHDVYGCM